MTTEIEIQVGLKSGMADPEGVNVKKALNLLGINSVKKVESVKCYKITIEKNETEAIQEAEAEAPLTEAEAEPEDPPSVKPDDSSDAESPSDSSDSSSSSECNKKKKSSKKSKKASKKEKKAKRV